MTIKIVRGREKTPAKVVIYGTEGIGKTSLASQFPNALILDTEDGSKRLDVARSKCPDWPALTLAMRELAVHSHGFETVVVDSIDWAAAACERHVCKAAGKKSIEDWGFGKGYKVLADQFADLIDAAEAIVTAGLHVVFVAHAKVVRTSPPDLTDGYDRYELDLHKQLAPMVKEWADAVLFCNYRTKLVDGNDGRRKATGGKERILYAERTAAFDSKNRFGLAAELPMTIDSLAPLFAGGTKAAKPDAMAVMTKASKAIADAKDEAALAKCRKRIDDLLADGTLTSDQWGALTDQIDAKTGEEVEHGVA